MRTNIKDSRADCSPMRPCVQLSIYPDAPEAYVCPICCEFIAFVGTRAAAKVSGMWATN